MIWTLFPVLCLLSVRIVRSTSTKCPYPAYSSHQIQITQTFSHSLINSSTPGLFPNQSKYGVEGGQVIQHDNNFYLFITEFTGDPYFVPSNLAIWKSPSPGGPWTRVKTIFKSGGKVDCNDLKASLGSSISVTYSASRLKWIIYYVGFKSCHDQYFVNREGRIFMAESIVNGPGGILGPYQDIGVVLAPDANSQPWEGLQGVDSFSNPFQVGNVFYAFYGSALTAKKPCCNQRVGLAASPSLSGPWKRLDYPKVNPISLANPNNHTEQPIVFRFKDGSFGAVYDSLNTENQGNVGYTWSPDGVSWDPRCGTILAVNPPGGPHWGNCRTPQGLVQMSSGKMVLFFSGYENNMPYFEAFGYALVSVV